MNTADSTAFFQKFVPQFVLRLILLLAISSFIANCVRSDEIKSTQDNAPKQNVDLTIAALLPSTNILAFSMTNLSQKPIYMEDVTSPPCHFVLIKPDGEKAVTFSSLSDNYSGPPIKSGETKRWNVNISERFKRYFTENGIYRLTWVYTQRISEDQTMEVKSNEFLILKNEDSPKINPDTGQPE